MGSVDSRDLGLASSATSTTRILGQLSSTAIVTLVFAVRIGGAGITQDDIPLYPQLSRQLSSLQHVFLYRGLFLSGLLTEKHKSTEIFTDP